MDAGRSQGAPDSFVMALLHLLSPVARRSAMWAQALLALGRNLSKCAQRPFLVTPGPRPPPPHPARPPFAGLFGVYAVADPRSDHEDLCWTIMQNMTKLCYSVGVGGGGGPAAAAWLHPRDPGLLWSCLLPWLGVLSPLGPLALRAG